MRTQAIAVTVLLALVICKGALGGVLLPLGASTPWGVDGQYVVGGRTGGGFVYDLATQTYTVTIPNSTAARGISGNIVVGGWGIHGFMYDLASGQYTTLNAPLGVKTTPTGIDGTNVVGNYVDSAGVEHGFLYDIATNNWMTLDYPGGVNSSPGDISGDYIVGTYTEGNPFYVHSFLFDLTTSTWTTIGGLGMEAFGIDGKYVVGGTNGWGFASGWMYDLETLEFVDPLIGVSFPSGQLVTGYRILGISDETIVGHYRYVTGRFSVNAGFVYIGVPELGTFLLTSVVVALLFSKFNYQRRSCCSRRPME